MVKVGYWLITLGFLGAAWVAVQNATEINWVLLVPGGLGMLVGIVMARTGKQQVALHADTIAGNIEDMDQSLTRIAKNVAELNRDKGKIHTYDMRHKIDELLLDDLAMFADARETIGHKYGLTAYADIMTHFAAGERYLNRVWSCSADGYIDEVSTYLVKAEEQFNDVLQKFHEMQGRHG